MRGQIEDFIKHRKLDMSIDSYQDLHPLHRFNVSLGNNGSLSKLKKYSKELGLQLGCVEEPIFSTRYSKGVIQVDLMKDYPKDICFMAESKEAWNKGYKLPVFLGRCADGESVDFDLTEAPHVLIGGTTGSGKSIMLHSIVASMLQKHRSLGVKFIFIDPKRGEFSGYAGGPWNALGVVHDAKGAEEVIKRLLSEMEHRFDALNKIGARSLSEIDGQKPFSYIVLVIDELSDMMYSSGKKFQNGLIRLAQKSRAAGIHIVAATQHPSSKVLPGELKANFPVVIGCKTMSAIHSRVLFGESGAEKLLGRGDAFISGGRFNMKRFKGAYIDSGYAQHLHEPVSKKTIMDKIKEFVS